MARFPALPLWTDAYLGDCGHLNDAEHGIYLMLMIHIWRSPECRIPNNDEWLARRFRRSVEEVQRFLRPIIAEFCKTDGNWIWQARLRKEHARCLSNSKKNSESAKARWNKTKINTNAVPEWQYERNATISRSISINSEANASAAGEMALLPSPSSAKNVLWGDGAQYLSQRSGRPNTECRTLIGRWLKNHPEDAVLAAINKAQIDQAVDPIAFVSGCLKRAKAQNAAAGDGSGFRPLGFGGM